MAVKRIYDLSYITTLAESLQPTSYFMLDNDYDGWAEAKCMSVENMRNTILDNHVIGSGSSTAIMTCDNTQTATNKTFTSPVINSPKINSTLTCTATSTELNALSGSGITQPDMVKITGLTGNVQSQLDSKSTDDGFRNLTLNIATSGTTHYISSEDIQALLGVIGVANLELDPFATFLVAESKTAGKWEYLPVISSGFYVKTVNFVDVLDKLWFTCKDLTNYKVSLSVKLISI